VVLTSTTAWFTDSHDALPYGLQLDVCGTPPGPDAVIRLPLTGELVVDPAAINANDIVRTPEDRTLLIVQSNAGLLLRRIRVLAGPSRSTSPARPFAQPGRAAHLTRLRRAAHPGLLGRPALPAQRALHHAADADHPYTMVAVRALTRRWPAPTTAPAGADPRVREPTGRTDDWPGRPA
jgi:hypothetical protein